MQQYGRDYQPIDDFELNGQHRKTHVETVLIDVDVDNDDSQAVDLRGYGLIGLIVPDIDAANLTFYVCETEDGVGTYRQLYTGAGVAVTITGGVGDFAVSANALVGLAAYRWVKIHTSAIQTVDRAFSWILKA